MQSIQSFVHKYLPLVACLLVLSSFLLPPPSFAAESSSQPRCIVGAASVMAPDPFSVITDKITKLSESLKVLTTPIAILGITLVLLMLLFAPAMPELAQQNKGYIIRALVIVSVISIVPELVAAFAAAAGTK